MKTIKGFVFEVTGDELKAAYEKQATHHAERATYYEGKLGEWNALPPVELKQVEDKGAAARLKLLADLGEERGLQDMRSHAVAGERLMEGLGQLDGASMFQHKIDKHRTSSKTFSFLAAHIAKDDGAGLATYQLTLDELSETGLIGIVGEVMPGRIPRALAKRAEF